MRETEADCRESRPQKVFSCIWPRDLSPAWGVKSKSGMEEERSGWFVDASQRHNSLVISEAVSHSSAQSGNYEEAEESSVETQSRSEEPVDVQAWYYRAAALCGLNLDNKSQRPSQIDM